MNDTLQPPSKVAEKMRERKAARAEAGNEASQGDSEEPATNEAMEGPDAPPSKIADRMRSIRKQKRAETVETGDQPTSPSRRTRKMVPCTTRRKSSLSAEPESSHEACTEMDLDEASREGSEEGQQVPSKVIQDIQQDSVVVEMQPPKRRFDCSSWHVPLRIPLRIPLQALSVEPNCWQCTRG